jgi:hypothetical protein
MVRILKRRHPKIVGRAKAKQSEFRSVAQMLDTVRDGEGWKGIPPAGSGFERIDLRPFGVKPSENAANQPRNGHLANRFAEDVLDALTDRILERLPMRGYASTPAR